MGTVHFGNDHVAAILGFGDLLWGNILITRVYFVSTIWFVALIEMDLELEQTQQGSSHEVSVSTEGVEELKRIRKGDKDRAAAMIQAIDKMLKTRRIMRSLESNKGVCLGWSTAKAVGGVRLADIAPEGAFGLGSAAIEGVFGSGLLTRACLFLSEEPEFEVGNSEMPQDQEENPGNEDVEPKGKVVSKRVWFTKPKRPQELTDPD
nr:integrase, catalytic region, zinc finger, CCHC-type, peptidase aspartic, catalytic [Tanacetum cinerariifolium]